MRFLSTAGLVASTLIAAGCRGDSAGPADPVAGTWILTSVTGRPLPHLLSFTGATMVHLIADTLRVRQNGRFTRAWAHRTSDGPQVSIETFADSGTWNSSATATTFLFASDSLTRSGPFYGTTLALYLETGLHMYTPQYSSSPAAAAR